MLDKNYWDLRWQNNQTGWDLGNVSPAIKKIIDQISDKNTRILIPGCGNAYEAKYLLEKGFEHIIIVDILPTLTHDLEIEFKNTAVRVICDDFFNLTELYDLILEQTFFCALHPELREKYVRKMHSLLKPNGVLTGLLFDIEFEKEGPPFGGSEQEYRIIFEEYFHLEEIAKTLDSIEPRANSELFFKFVKK